MARGSLINNEGFIKPTVGSDFISQPNTPSYFWVYEAANDGSSDSGIAHTNSATFLSPTTSPKNQQGNPAPLQMGYLYNVADIFQQFDVPTTGNYTLNYSLAGPQANSIGLLSQPVVTTLDGSTIGNYTPVNTDWVTFTLPVHLTAGQHQIEFATSGTSPTLNYVSFVDEVYLTGGGDVPEPASLALLSLGSGALLIRRKR